MSLTSAVRSALRYIYAPLCSKPTPQAQWPLADTGRGALVSKADKELVQFAYFAASDLCDEHGAELSAAYGNFDRVVALGWRAERGSFCER